jgi:ubiquinone/menaquinone biosynthesis C-methylase UbiE
MQPARNPYWTAEKLLALGRGYQAAAVLAAAADLELFDAFAGKPRTAGELARLRDCDGRGLRILLDALVALRLLVKSVDRYAMPAGLAPLLTAKGAGTVLGMAQHQSNCLKRWAELAKVVKTGRPAKVSPSVRGARSDQQAFIEAMHNLSAPVAAKIIRSVRPLKFEHLLDVGGASGTWTTAFLQACPTAQATLFDLPAVLPLARGRLAAAGMSRRVRLVPGNFMKQPLPLGADLAWVSAIVHQNSRKQNRTLFGKILKALNPGGRIAIRDMLMEADHTHPVAGALFAVNMLVATQGGGTFTFDELREDLEAAGFVDATVRRQDEAMHSIVVAYKPGTAALRQEA